VKTNFPVAKKRYELDKQLSNDYKVPGRKDNAGRLTSQNDTIVTQSGSKEQ
jgi:hypothetical protein